MSKRTHILKALAEKLKLIDGTGIFKTNISNNSYPKLKFWDEVQDFPCIYLTPGTETRDYHPSGFTWAYLLICIKCYVKSEDQTRRQNNLVSCRFSR